MSSIQKGVISAVDTETIDGYAIVLANERKSWVANSFETCMKPIFSDIKNGKMGGRTFFYNITYDAQAILKYLPEENIKELLDQNTTVYDDRYSILFIRGKVFKIRDMRWKATMSGYDLPQFFNHQKLEDMGKQYLNEGKLKNDIITEITTKAQTHTANELYWIFAHNIDLIKEYCQQDALLTKRLGDYLANNINDMYGFRLSSYASKTGIGKKLTKDTVGYESYGNNKRVLCYPHFYENALPARMAKEAYHGGIFDASQRGSFKECTGIDISCFSDDTEILTIDGYKKYTDINIGDKVATLNINNGNIEYQPIEYIHIHDYNGDMVHVANKKIDILATPNHRIYYQVYNRNRKIQPDKYKTWSEYKIKELKDIPKTYIRIPTGGNYVDGKREYTDNEIKIFGWIITEGWFTKYGINISQSDKWNYQKEIKQILEDLNIEHSVKNRGKRNYIEKSFKSNYDEYNFHIFSKDSKNIKEKLNYKKEINQNWVKDWDKESLEVLFWTLMRGDGSGSVNNGHKNKLEFKGSNHDLECVLEICLKIGYKANINYKAHAIYITQHQDSKFHLLTMGNKNTVWDKEMYNGKVWCVTVPNDTIFVKRNGKQYVTGNSAYPFHQKDLPNWSNGDFVRANQDTLEDTDQYGWGVSTFNYPMIPYTSDLINTWNEYHGLKTKTNNLQDENNLQTVTALNKRKFYPIGERAQTITLLEYRFLKKHNYLIDNTFTGFVWRVNKAKKQYPAPFSWINKVYDMKQQIKVKEGGDSYKYSLTKIPMNSMYGTTAQKIGYAQFKNYFYASSITAGTRIQICEMLEKVGYDKQISIATDGILLDGHIDLPDKYTFDGLGSWDVDHYKSALILANGMYRLEKEDGIVKQGLRGMLSYKGDLKQALEKNRDQTSFLPDVKPRPVTMHQALCWGRYTKEDMNKFVMTGRVLNCNVDSTKRWFGINTFRDLLDNNFRGERFTVDEVDKISKKAMDNLPDGVRLVENTRENTI